MRLRLLSLIIVACLILLALKISGIAKQPNIFSNLQIISSAMAQENSQQDAIDDVIEAKEVPVSQTDEIIYSKEELNILQRLSKRREKLSIWEKDLRSKQNILDITQIKINKKINELRTLKSEVEENLAKYNLKESKKTASLVKIYENIKPKPAAKIMASLKIETIISIAQHMKEDKLALILAKMDPVLASEITSAFVQHGKLITELNDKK